MVSKMIVPVLVLLLCATVSESLLAGDSCNVSKGEPGICTPVAKCKPVYQDLLAGSSSATICGHDKIHFYPIVCCPTNPLTTTTTSIPPVDLSVRSDGRGAIARRKCAEYSKYVWKVQYSPFGDRRPVNVSQCAVKSIPLISGGTKADRMEFPHMAAIGYRKKHGRTTWECGGTLISERFVLTAAHCTFHSTLGNAKWVRVGGLNLKREERGVQYHRIIKQIRHPEYKPPSLYHDIALLQLKTQATLNGWVKPACLHTEPSTGTERAVATGWGHVDWMEEASDDLLKVTLSLVNSQTCRARWGAEPPSVAMPNGPNGNWSICASDGKCTEKPCMDTCQGDSGGPMVIFNKREYCMYDLVGVTSVGKTCDGDFPGVYTRVYHYVSWIESKVWPRG